MLDAALDLLASSQPLSLAGAAHAAGTSKSGLMYHFPTREALLTALVEHVVDGYVGELRAEVSALVGEGVRGPEDVDAEQRLLAYLSWACRGERTTADLVAFTDPALREQLSRRWSERLEPWTRIPADLPPISRARLLAMRAAADGVWFDGASGTQGMSPADRADILSHFTTNGEHS